MINYKLPYSYLLRMISVVRKLSPKTILECFDFIVSNTTNSKWLVEEIGQADLLVFNHRCFLVLFEVFWFQAFAIPSELCYQQNHSDFTTSSKFSGPFHREWRSIEKQTLGYLCKCHIHRWQNQTVSLYLGVSDCTLEYDWSDFCMRFVDHQISRTRC